MPPQRKLSAEEQKQVEVIEMAGRLGKAAGCPQDQVENFLMAGVQLQFKQLQIAALCRECDKPNGPKDIMAGGGRGSAKSHGILAQIFCDDCQRVKGLKVLCLRKVGRANKEQVQDFRKKLLAHLPHNYREQAQTIEFDNGSIVILGNFKDEKDIDKYLGLEYDLIYIMESNQLTLTKKMNILSCLRTNKTNWRPRCYEDTNPGGVGHFHNKQIFYQPWKIEQKIKKCKTEDDIKVLCDDLKLTREQLMASRETETRYIHSTVDDNKFVDSGYKQYLEKLVGWQREAWLNGSWEFMAGSYFTNFIYDIHVYPNKICTFFNSNARSFFGSFDFGFSHNSAFLLFAKDIQENIYVIDEYMENELTPSDHAEGIKALLRNHNLEPTDLDSIVAGHDCFHRNEEGRTIAQTYEENGLTFLPAENARVNGWSRMMDLFGNLSTGKKPKLFINKKCVNLITQIQMAQHHEKISGDIQKFNADENGENGDDMLDAARIGLFSNTSTAIKMAIPVAFGRPLAFIGG